MPYLGNTPTTQNFISGTDYFSGNGSTTAFTLTRTVNSVNDIQVTVNNVVQQPNDAYTLNGTTLTFTSTPSAGTNNIYVRYLSTTTQSITPAAGVTVLAAQGTATAPSYSFNSDSNTGMFSPAADTIAFTEGGVESMRIDSNGRVGIGTTAPAYTVDVQSSSNPAVFLTNTSTGLDCFIGTSGAGVAQFGSTDQGLRFVSNNAEAIRVDTSGNVGIGTSSPSNKLDVVGADNTIVSRIRSTSGTIRFLPEDGSTAKIAATNGADNAFYPLTMQGSTLQYVTGTTERMRLGSGGGLMLNNSNSTSLNAGQIRSEFSASTYTSPGDNNLPCIQLYNTNNSSSTAHSIVLLRTGGSSGGSAFISYDIANEAGWSTGILNSDNSYRISNTWNSLSGTGVYITQGATSWTGTSDERLKDIIEPITNGAEKVASLRAVIGKFKNDKEDTRRAFLIAQDVQKVLPEAVDTNNPEELGIRYTEVIPLLVSAIQELKADLDEAKAEIAALKEAK